MKVSVVTVGVGAILVGVMLSASHTSETPAAVQKAPCSFMSLPRATKARQVVLWGHIRSLTRKGGSFELKFDPALWLNGLTASRAALEDTGSSDVANDYYVVDESHRQFTYAVPVSARVTLLSKRLCSVAIGVPELAQIVKGKNPRQRPLFDRGRHLGYWISVSAKYPNPALSLDQQYQP